MEEKNPKDEIFELIAETFEIIESLDIPEVKYLKFADLFKKINAKMSNFKLNQSVMPNFLRQHHNTTSTYCFPCDATLQHAAKLSVVENKPLLFDYWVDSLDKKVLIGIKEGTGEKLLVKSVEEYTSPIAKFYKSLTEYILITENSIYVVASDIPFRKIS